MKRGITSLPAGRAYYRDQYKVTHPYQGRGSDIINTKEHPEYNQVVQWKRENMTRQASESDAEQWSSSSWTWSFSSKSSWWDSSSSQTRASTTFDTGMSALDSGIVASNNRLAPFEEFVDKVSARFHDIEQTVESLVKRLGTPRVPPTPQFDINNQNLETTVFLGQGVWLVC